jgi:hypothetical protein
MKVEYLVIYAKRYSFIDRQDGREVEGCKVMFLNPSDFEESNDSIGYKIAEQNLPFERFDDFKGGPGIYSVEFEPIFTSKGVKLRPVKFTFDRPMDLTEALIIQK